MDSEEWKRRAREITTPTDYDSLVRAGVLKKKDGDWYEIVKLDELPEHARAKISAVTSGQPIMVKFLAPSKRLEKMVNGGLVRRGH